MSPDAGFFFFFFWVGKGRIWARSWSEVMGRDGGIWESGIPRGPGAEKEKRKIKEGGVKRENEERKGGKWEKEGK